jgi:hypothetical protein
MRPILSKDWAVRIREKMTGIYGHRPMSNKFSHIVKNENNIEEDIGTALFIRALQEQLGFCANRPEAIAWMIDKLPAGRIPDVKELVELCRAAPRPIDKMIEYKPSDEDIERAEAAKKAIADSISSQNNRDNRAWIAKLKERESSGEKLSLIQTKAIAEAGGVRNYE